MDRQRDRVTWRDTATPRAPHTLDYMDATTLRRWGPFLLITQKSRVQIPPSLLVFAAQRPFPIRERAFDVTGHVTKYVTKREPVLRAGL